MQTSLIADFKESIKRLFSNRHILWNITLKELKSKYSGSLLGIWWALVTPLLIMGAISFVFTKVIKIDIENFPLFSLAAIMPWFFFSVSLSESTSSLSRNSSLLKQFVFPVEFLPFACVLSNFINFVFGLLLLIPVFIIFKVKIISFLAFFPLVLFVHMLFTLGLALLLSCIAIFFRDINHLLGIILMFWFWITPVFYSAQMVPEHYRFVCTLNPMSGYITMYRDVLFEARFPNRGIFLGSCIISLVVALAGYVIFKRLEPLFVKRI